MGVGPRMGQQTSFQRRLPLGLNSASQQEVNTPPADQPQKVISKSNQSRISSKYSANSRFVKMASSPSPKRRRATELVKLSLGSNFFPRGPTLDFGRRRCRSSTSRNSLTQSCAPVVNGSHFNVKSRPKNAPMTDRVDESIPETLKLTAVKCETDASPSNEAEKLKQQQHLLEEKDAEIERLRQEVSKLRERVASLEEQIGDSERMRPPRVGSSQRSRADSLRSAGGGQRLRQEDNTSEKKPRKSVRMQDPLEKSIDKKASADEFAVEDQSMTVMPYTLYQRTTEEDVHRNSGSIEVPRWREKPIGESSSDTTNTNKQGGTVEATSDEVYLKRHSKLEVDEKRRKRWDKQWLSEQKNYERARRRQARRSQNVHQTSVKGVSPGSFPQCQMGSPVTSFFPSGSRLRVIEISDRVPVMAWGCTVPQFKYSLKAVDEAV